jgi:hypothetical protein
MIMMIFCTYSFCSGIVSTLMRSNVQKSRDKFHSKVRSGFMDLESSGDTGAGVWNLGRKGNGSIGSGVTLIVHDE